MNKSCRNKFRPTINIDMRRKNISLGILVCSITLFFVSCKDDDTPVTPTNPVIFTLDSLAVWLQPGGSGFASGSQTFEQTTTASSVKVEYTVQTNADSIHSEAWVRDSSNGTPPHPVETYYYWNVDSLVSYFMDIPSQPIYIKLEVRLRTYNNDIPRYVRLRNIKVTKQ